MKILHIINCLNEGGAEAVLYRLCKHDSDNIHVCVSLKDGGKYGPLLQNAGVKVISLGISNNILSLTFVIKLFKLMLQIKPDVVQTWMYHSNLFGGIIAKLAGIKNIIWGIHHTNLNKDDTKLSTRFIAKLNSLFSWYIPKKIVYCAQKAKEVQESFGFNKKKGIVIRNGFNLREFNFDPLQRENFRNEFGIEDSIFLIGHVGRFSPYKDYQNLINSFSLLNKLSKNTIFVLVGSGLDDSNESLMEMIKYHSLSEKILLLGRNEDIPKVMNGFDIFVLSSSTEAFPNVLNEAMACSIPCVSTDVGDASIIIGNTGWVVPPKNPTSLAKAMLEAISEKESNIKAWSKRKENCRNHIVDNFNIDKMILSYKSVWYA